MSVYVITEGSYEDYHIEAIYTREDLAKQHIENSKDYYYYNFILYHYYIRDEENNINILSCNIYFNQVKNYKWPKELPFELIHSSDDFLILGNNFK